MTAAVDFYDPDKRNGVLANFFPCRLRAGGRTYPSAEHLYQAIKFHRRRIVADTIRRAPTPLRAKLIARAHRFERFEGWPSVRLLAMRMVVELRAGQDRRFRAALLATGSTYIRELTEEDRFWGVSSAGRGENHMGRILIEVRRQGRRGSVAPPDLRSVPQPAGRLFLRQVRAWI